MAVAHLLNAEKKTPLRSSTMGTFKTDGSQRKLEKNDRKKIAEVGKTWN